MSHIFLTCCCFWIKWPYFYSVVAVPRSALPFTLKATESSVSALQLSQHCYNVYVCTYIPLLFFTVYCLLQNLKVLVRIFHVNCMSQQDRRELFPLWSNTAFRLTKDESVNSLHCSEVCSSCNYSFNSWMLLQHTRSLSSNMLVCLTASSYKIYYYAFLRKIPPLKKVDEPLFCICDKMSLCLVSF